FQRDSLVGRVVAVPEVSGGEFLEVEPLTGKRLIIPFSKHFVGKVDIGDRRIELTEEYELP
ncbi:MAG: 16S rRNA processing protein RimM, partial [Spirochaetia bacterium]